MFAQRVLDPLLVAALVPAMCLAHGQPFGRPYQMLASLALLTSMSAFRMVNLYRWEGPTRPHAVVGSVMLAWTCVAAVLAALGMVTGSMGTVSYDVVQAWALAAPLLLTTSQLFGRAGMRALGARGIGTRKGVVVGVGPNARDFASRVLESPAAGIRLAGFFDDRKQVGDTAGLPLLGQLSELAGYVKDNGIAHVFIALPMVGSPRVARILEGLLDTTASVSFVPQMPTPGLPSVNLEEVAGVPLFTSCDTPFADWGRRLVKRATDIIIASLGLLLAAPIMIVVALAVKLTSRGPVLFCQRRYGLDGQQIVVYKFRTMTVMEDGSVVRQAQHDDPRVTRLGRFLRSASLDELPQFINVLQGRMSVIGPRPHAVVHNEHYRSLIAGYMRRHKIKPGLSGWAQVHGYRGETRTVDDMRARIEHDLYYMRNWSLRLDLVTAIKTLFVLFGRRNAY